MNSLHVLVPRVLYIYYPSIICIQFFIFPPWEEGKSSASGDFFLFGCHITTVAQLSSVNTHNSKNALIFFRICQNSHIPTQKLRVWCII